MNVRVYRSGKGDCLFITGADGKALLVDGGVPDAYADHWSRSLSFVHGSQPIDVVMVSHIDRDHIGGILRMLDNKVAWKVFRYQSSLPPSLRTRNPRKPSLREPPDVQAIWHNAFFETVRRRVFDSSPGGASAGLDIHAILAGSAAILAADTENPEHRETAATHQLLAQSVGDAIEVSRRIGSQQLGIPLNPEFDGGFMVRGSGSPEPRIGGMTATILGPTEKELKRLLTTWNAWLRQHGNYLKGLLRRHDEDAGALPPSSAEGVLRLARSQAIELAGNQTVTPPNLASLIVLLREGDERILLTGDADDPTILEGLEETGNLAAGGHVHLSIFKVPHHGAHNSYSDELARRVTADHYVFCGDGEHGNPEKDIVEGYLAVLFEGTNGHPPAAPPNRRIRFWFNCSERLAKSKFKSQWRELEEALDGWEGRFSRFSARFQRSGQSFRVA